MNFIVLLSPTLAYFLPETHTYTHAHTLPNTLYSFPWLGAENQTPRFWVRRVESGFEGRVGVGWGLPRVDQLYVFRTNQATFESESSCCWQLHGNIKSRPTGTQPASWLTGL